MSEEIKQNPLFTIFEKHLYDFNSNEDTEAEFITNVMNDYLTFLESKKVVVPHKWKMSIQDELREQIRSMMIKKMYGCVSLDEFITKQTDIKEKRKLVRKKYSKLG